MRIVHCPYCDTEMKPYTTLVTASDGVTAWSGAARCQNQKCSAFGPAVFELSKEEAEQKAMNAAFCQKEKSYEVGGGGGWHAGGGGAMPNYPGSGGKGYLGVIYVD